ncbi:pyridoxal phosphate-dependent decarboxylase family protein [Siphonobacter curvatus]|uniref:Aspartate aminotransferase family protein n=1 Tax=Siphonobacter curvatus TaxID=2094562 RepID=A0A2S7ITC4_9BACT|nr:pyridoxal-dependent decarboxylase [Siphonobacter curvatus]PQA60878.1 aspartate aminotransferase family protein [Siphonobacter curvatus]
MNSFLQTDIEQWDDLLAEVRSQATAYLQNIESVPTSPQLQDFVSAELPAAGWGTAQALAFFRQHYQPWMVASAGPRYWGYVVGGTTPAAMAGDWLTSVFDANPQSLQGTGDRSAQLEVETIRSMRQLLGLPDTFTGGFVSGATMSIFTGLAVARQWAGVQMGQDIARKGLSVQPIVLAATPHSAVRKAMAMLGMGSNRLIKLRTLPDREAVDLEDLEEKLRQYQGQPIIVSTSAGTVNTVDFDDFLGVQRLRQQYPFWWHVDAAFGGFAACSPQYADRLRGWENADSITVDCHKWMNVPYDSAVIFTQRKHQHLQVQTFQNSNAPYLGDPDEDFSYLNFLPDNSRRLRALPAWFSLMAYGKAGFADRVEQSVRCAQRLGEALETSTDFRLVAPVRLNVVCFTLRQMPERAAEFLALLNQRGKVFITPTLLEGTFCLRAAFVNFRTTESHVDEALEELSCVLQVLNA